MRTFAVVFAFASLAAGQEPKAANGFKVQIAVQEMEGAKRLNTRAYTLQVSEARVGRLSINNKLPVQTGSGQYQFYDVGLDLTCRMDELGSQPMLDSTVRLTTVAESEGRAPVTTNQFQTNVLTPVTLGKTAPIAEFDDIGSKRHFVVEATVNRLK